MIDSVQDIQHVLYINLENRSDRRLNIENQLKLLGLYEKQQRFNAIRMHNGALGCSYSHLECLETAKREGWEHVLIVEDDMVISDIELFLSQLNLFLARHKEWDVLMLGGNNSGRYTQIDNTCVRITSCLTSVAYLVKNHYYDVLINNLREGAGKLKTYPHRKTSYALDKYWFKLQKKDTWLLLQPLLISQLNGYSDIERRNVNYRDSMIKL